MVSLLFEVTARSTVFEVASVATVTDVCARNVSMSRTAAASSRTLWVQALYPYVMYGIRCLTAFTTRPMSADEAGEVGSVDGRYFFLPPIEARDLEQNSSHSTRC